MMIFDAIAATTGLALIWAGATGRLTTILTDPNTGREGTTHVGNGLALGAGLCVLVSALF